MGIRDRIRRARERDTATRDLLSWKPNQLSSTPPAPTASLTEQRAFWYAELRRQGFHDHERPDGRLIDTGPFQASRPGGFSGNEIAEAADWHTALCRAYWRWACTPDEREAVRMVRDGKRYATVALELGRRKEWIVDVIRRAVAWGLAESNEEDTDGRERH